MLKKGLLSGILILICSVSFGQELFPHAQPASTMPKGLVGVRFTYDRYREQSSGRNKDSYHLRFMYGITAKWTIMATLGISNHHYKTYPTDLLNFFFNHHLQSYPSPAYALEGINLYTKYRFFTRDNYHQHFRLAVFVEACNSFVAHDNAEPTLMTDNTGYGGGLIATYLYERFAASLTAGFIHPLMYTQDDIQVKFQSGDAAYLELSTGYRVWPLKYASYSDININIYSEFAYKKYGGAYVEQYGKEIDFSPYAASSPYTVEALSAGSYVDGHFYVQFISNSNSRLDVGVTLALSNRSYNYWSPLYTIQYQTYLYKRKKQKLQKAPLR